MYYNGLTVGLMTFLIIGLFHPIVIKGEYYFGKKIWPVFLIGGLSFCFISVLVENPTLSAAFGVTGFTCLWSIHELLEQEKRVSRGWFPKNPKNASNKDIAINPETGDSSADL